MKKTTVIICSLIILIICLVVLMGFMKLDKKESNTTTTTTTEEIVSSTTTTSKVTDEEPEPSIKTNEETPEPRTPVTSIKTPEEDTTEAVSTSVITGIKCDDNNKLAWGNVMFAIEDNDLYIYLNDENTKYKTTISDVNCIAYERIPKSSFGTIKIYKDEILKKSYSYSEMNQFTEDNIEKTIGKLEKVE